MHAPAGTESSRAARGALDGRLPLERRSARALYVHVPFCARRCPYCDFATADLNAAVEARYLDALEAEARARVPADLRPRTVYLGGGTPAELTTTGVERLGRLLGPLCAGAREVTLEANPRTLLPRKLAALRDALRVNRLSLGVQSFQPRLLDALGRFHRPEDVVRAVAVARELGIEQVSIDLIFAVPGQTEEELDRDIDAALALRPEHVSVYGLTIEPGTAFHAARARGELVETRDGRQARLYARLRRRLRAAGLEHYEVSSFARRGRRSRHNRVYWRNHPYVGLGNGAASHLGGERLTNHRDVGAYCDAIARDGGAAATADRETLAPDRKLRETAWLALRTSRGIDPRVFLRDTGHEARVALRAELDQLARAKLIHEVGGRIVLTGRGVSLADAAGAIILSGG